MLALKYDTSTQLVVHINIPQSIRLGVNQRGIYVSSIVQASIYNTVHTAYARRQTHTQSTFQQKNKSKTITRARASSPTRIVWCVRRCNWKIKSWKWLYRSAVRQLTREFKIFTENNGPENTFGMDVFPTPRLHSYISRLSRYEWNSMNKIRKELQQNRIFLWRSALHDARAYGQ